MEPDAVEIRVLGCLIEKQRTTPDAYPLSLNSLRLACNQSTNRDPVVAFDEETVSAALRRLAQRGWTRLTSGANSRARKYRHLLPEALGLDDAEVALLAVLMLRGEQTPGELKQRSERLQGFTDLAAVQETLDGLVERGWAVRHERRPGQKEERFSQLLGGGEGEVPAAEAGTPAPVAAEVPSMGVPDEVVGSGDPAAEDDRLRRLEDELKALRGELSSLREALGGD
jgi:uncharacterized protein